MENQHFIELIYKYTSQTLTHEEGRKLAELLEQDQHQKQFQQLLLQQITNGELNLDQPDEKSFRNIEADIVQRISAEERQLPVIPSSSKRWWRYAAAVILCTGIGAYLWNRTNSPGEKELVSTTIPVDKLPGKNQAVLVLADESVVNLDSLLPGQSIVQGSMQITKSAEGELLYSPAAIENDNEGVFINTMKTPNGGQYQLTLPDGTQAWLNAASSITYPTRFTGNNREVKVSGEVYLEVAKHKSKPFIVNTGQQEIIVLGTAFNINNYSGEAGKISLLQGSVKINGQLLKPGQAFTNGKIQSTNTSQDIAWRNGVFNFNDQSLPEVMRQIARWYDVKIVYEGKLPSIEFTGELSRTLTLSEVVEFLKGSQVNVEWKNNQLVIKQ